MGVRLVVHGHFYQPPRENPWTEEVAAEPSAAPFHDWNERITVECYRPNGWARIVDDRGRVVDIVSNYERMSFDVGPTLLSWLEIHAPDVHDRMVECDETGRGALAQAYNHVIMPLTSERDMRTQVRWGLADFAHRYGRPAEGMWLPETAVDDAVLRVLAEEGVRWTILAPHQATLADGSPAPTGVPVRWMHPGGDGRHVDLVLYDGPISHDIAFALTGMSSQELVRRVLATADDDEHDGGAVVVATDGETFGHHHKWADRALAFALSHEAPSNGIEVVNVAALVHDSEPAHAVEVSVSSWSCIHGVERWRANCGCRTGGEPWWDQEWRAPLRAAFDLVREEAEAVFERRGSQVLRDPWAARDAYIGVLLAPSTLRQFLDEHLVEGGDDVLALTLLEAQRHSLLMYTSCGWFFNDLAGIETLQVMRYAARCIDLLEESEEAGDLQERVLDVLGGARSNVASEGTGRDIWRRHVDPSRVDPGRVAAHLALVGLLERGEPPAVLGVHEVVEHQRRTAERGGLAGVAGRVVLVHRRTRRRTAHVYAAVHLGGLEVFGATRPADPARDRSCSPSSSGRWSVATASPPCSG